MIRTTALPRRLPVLFAAAVLALSACSSGGDGTADAADTVADAMSLTDDSDTTASSDDDENVGAGVDDDGSDAVGTLASSEVHELSFEFDEDDYAEMIETYTSTGDKEWIEATVTIDGVTYEEAGIRLKGNSSLRGIAGGGRAGGPAGGPGGDASADDPSSLPWLVKLDKYVDGQSHDGLTDLVVRSNNSDTALNEAVALDLLEAAGLASQDAIAVAFSVNGSDQVLRLVIEHPDDVWMAEWFDDDGALYKAESTGDYSYRGDDPDAYDDVFDQEAGKDNADLTPLIEFLEWLNESDDETFAAELADRLDVDAFATYLAMQELIGNFDDIDGPGNNSYLYYDTDTGRFTVVPWDHNLAFGALAGGGFPGGFPDGGAGGFPGGAPDGAPGDVTTGDLPAPTGDRPARPVPADGEAPTPPTGGFPGGGQGGGPGGGPGGGAFGGSNVLVERFLAVDEFQSLYDQRLEELRAELVDSGLADEILAGWVDVVTSSTLVDESTITTESAAIATYFD